MPWLLEMFARALEPAEREAVLGDLAESGKSATLAAGDLIGLIARRQAQAWKHAGAWLVLIGLVIPLGSLLSRASGRTADGTAIYLWMFANNWDTGLLLDPAYRELLASFGFNAFLSFSMLACWAWTAGLALGSWSRDAFLINGTFFCVLLAVGSGGLSVLHRAREFPGNAAVFGPIFYRIVFPLIIQLGLVIPAAMLGIRQGRGLRHRRSLLKFAALATAAFIIIQITVLGRFSMYERLPGTGSATLVLSCWPIAYWIATPIHRRLKGRTTT